MGKQFQFITQANAVPDELLGGSSGQQKFFRFPKQLLINLVNSLISTFVVSRPPCITLTGITGTTVTNESLEGRSVGFIIINDFPKNTGFAKGDENALESTSLIIDNYNLKPEDVITIYFSN